MPAFTKCQHTLLDRHARIFLQRGSPKAFVIWNIMLWYQSFQLEDTDDNPSQGKKNTIKLAALVQKQRDRIGGTLQKSFTWQFWGNHSLSSGLRAPPSMPKATPHLSPSNVIVERDSLFMDDIWYINNRKRKVWIPRSKKWPDSLHCWTILLPSLKDLTTSCSPVAAQVSNSPSWFPELLSTTWRYVGWRRFYLQNQQADTKDFHRNSNLRLHHVKQIIIPNILVPA